MTLEEALSALQSRSTRHRMQAAHFFLSGIDPESVPYVKDAYRRETDVYVRQRLEQVLKGVDASARMSEEAIQRKADNAVASPDVVAQVTEWVGGMILHEMEGGLGRAAYYASKEIQAFDSSRTKIELDSLKDVFRGIEQLVLASKSPRLIEFDLYDLILEAVNKFEDVSISLVGQRPLMVRGDRSLLALALINGLKNAVEAVREELTSDYPVVINWGETDRDYWLSILDNGPGVNGAPGPKFEIGSSTKNGHSGFGLAVARRAMSALLGTVELRSTGDGAIYELRWGRGQ